MTQADFGEFSQEIRRLVTVFRVKASPAELNQLIDAYFHALQRFTSTQIINATDAWIARESKFPKPAELAMFVPRRVVELETLNESDAAVLTAAELARWEFPPCECLECWRAEVDEKPLRFVPEERKVRIGDREVTAGHWAHGDELARWYRARADFYETCLRLGLRGDVLKPEKRRTKFHERMAAIFAKGDA